ncbi:MAG: hypothetical protein ACKVY0_18790 [Prosthecobacter sp.]|uniref:hypothetical protein n=1 Tax=Prosthecobacter sp. TaxID=1965333 RepID=UPI0039002055
MSEGVPSCTSPPRHDQAPWTFCARVFAEFLKNLASNHIDTQEKQIIAGPWLDYDPTSNRFAGEFAAEANKLCQEEYAAGFELPS